MTGRSIAPPSLPVAVIGGGFSGAVTAAHLARTLSPHRPIAVFEQGAVTGAGIAFKTEIAGHLLNVRAANMSLFADNPSHFEDWLAQNAKSEAADLHATEVGVFASRRLYARYIRATFDAVFTAGGASVRQKLGGDAIVDCERLADRFILVSAAGRRHEAAAIVLATGHPRAMPSNDPRHVTDPWAPHCFEGLLSNDPVLVLGTGLTMIDILIGLRHAGFTGAVTALSRRGLLPHAHQAIVPRQIPCLAEDEQARVLTVLTGLRRDVETVHRDGGDWRQVIDSLRPITTQIWTGWPIAERERFLRHAKRWWDCHRHRMAPPVAREVGLELRRGGLTVLAGRLMEMTGRPDGLAVRYRRLCDGAEVTRSFQRVFRATGLEGMDRHPDALPERLVARGLARRDPLGIGLEASPDLHLIGAAGEVQPGIWGLGPVVRGSFWECVAVPDIRVQAADCAKGVAAYLG